jgi:hypothetical protein
VKFIRIGKEYHNVQGHKARAARREHALVSHLDDKVRPLALASVLDVPVDVEEHLRMTFLSHSL